MKGTEPERGEAAADFAELARICYAFRVALARRVLRDLQNDDNEWPGRQEWDDLVPTSHSALMALAADEAGLDRQAVIDFFNSRVYGAVELEEPAQAAARPDAAPPVQAP